MKPIHVALCLAAVAAAAGASDPREMDDFKAEVQQLRSEIQELRSVLNSAISNSNSPSEAAAPGRRQLQTSGGDEHAQISWDGESLNVQSTAAGKSVTLTVLGDLNITGDIYLNGNLLQTVPTSLPTSTPISLPTSTPIVSCSGGGSVTSSTSWNSDDTAYSSVWLTGTNYQPSNTLDGDTSTFWLGDMSVASEFYLIYDLGSEKTIHGVQIGNGQDVYGVQETLLQSGTSISGPWTTESTFTVTNANNGGGADNVLVDYATDVLFSSQYIRLYFNSNVCTTASFLLPFKLDELIRTFCLPRFCPAVWKHQLFKIMEFAVYTC